MEILAGVTNALAYFSIALPILGWSWPALELPEVLQLLLASCGAALAGISSFCGSIIKLIKACLIFSGSLQISNGSLDLMAAAGAGGLVAGFLADEALAQAQDNLKTGNTGDEQGDTDLENDEGSKMLLELDSDYDTIADKKQFGDEICQDVARAAGLNIEAGEICILDICKAPEPKKGVLVYLVVHSDKISEQEVVKDLKAQLNDKHSLLRSGVYHSLLVMCRLPMNS